MITRRRNIQFACQQVSCDVTENVDGDLSFVAFFVVMLFFLIHVHFYFIYIEERLLFHYFCIVSLYLLPHQISDQITRCQHTAKFSSLHVESLLSEIYTLLIPIHLKIYNVRASKESPPPQASHPARENKYSWIYSHHKYSQSAEHIAKYSFGALAMPRLCMMMIIVLFIFWFI